jgi:ADP-ribose pyrophosphatase
MLKPWPRRKTEKIFRSRIFELRRDLVRSPRLDVEQEVLVLEAGVWVNIIPLTDDGQVVMVRQFRHGTRSVTLEIPGGLVDPGDASPQAAALRELREETGYEAARVRQIGTVEPNPAIFDNVCHTFLAEGVRPATDQSLDHGEDIEVELWPLSAMPGLIASGQIRHALVVAAFYHLEHDPQRAR